MCIRDSSRASGEAAALQPTGTAAAPGIEARVNKLLGQMTVDEKLQQHSKPDVRLKISLRGNMPERGRLSRSQPGGAMRLRGRGAVIGATIVVLSSLARLV